MIPIRHKTPADYQAVRHEKESAIETPAEANLIDTIRNHHGPFLSMMVIWIKRL